VKDLYRSGPHRPARAWAHYGGPARLRLPGSEGPLSLRLIRPGPPAEGPPAASSSTSHWHRASDSAWQVPSHWQRPGCGRRAREVRALCQTLPAVCPRQCLASGERRNEVTHHWQDPGRCRAALSCTVRRPGAAGPGRQWSAGPEGKIALHWAKLFWECILSVCVYFAEDIIRCHRIRE
jgi:hypothetical protein